MRREEKLEISLELTKRLANAKAIIVTEYRGMKVKEVSILRKEMRKNDGEIKVVKNRLVQKAIASSDWAALAPQLKGPVALAICDQDPVILTKILTKYAETVPALKIKGGIMGGNLLSAKDVEALSKLPSKEELYAKLLGTLMAPATNVVRTIQGVSQKLVLALKAISEKQ